MPAVVDGEGRVGGGAAVELMRLGDIVTYAGRRYILRGLDPMGVPVRCADLEDADTGERIRVPITDLRPA